MSNPEWNGLNILSETNSEERDVGEGGAEVTYDALDDAVKAGGSFK